MNAPKNRKVPPKYGIGGLIADIMIGCGIVLLGLPFVWSVRSDTLQSKEMDAAQAQAPPTPVTRTSVAYTPTYSYTDPIISIPRLGMRAAIVEETTQDDLDKGPMHLTDSALPGDPGNCCIAAHKEKWFRSLGKLNKRDTVIIKAYGSKFIYTITGKRIVQDDDLSVLDTTKDATLTLITCTGPAYFGHGKGRLIVTASLSDTK